MGESVNITVAMVYGVQVKSERLRALYKRLKAESTPDEEDSKATKNQEPEAKRIRVEKEEEEDKDKSKADADATEEKDKEEKTEDSDDEHEEAENDKDDEENDEDREEWDEEKYEEISKELVSMSKLVICKILGTQENHGFQFELYVPGGDTLCDGEGPAIFLTHGNDLDDTTYLSGGVSVFSVGDRETKNEEVDNNMRKILKHFGLKAETKIGLHFVIVFSEYD